MKTLTLAVLIIAYSAIPLYCQNEDFKAAQAVRLALQGQSIRVDSRGGWTFQNNEIVAVDVVALQKIGNRVIATADIKTSNAPGLITSRDGRVYVTELSGRVRVTMGIGERSRVENISLSRREIPIRYEFLATPAMPTLPYVERGRPIMNRNITVGSGRYIFESFKVHTYGTLSGRIQASGGDGQIEAFIMNDAQLKDYRNGMQTFPEWSSGGLNVVSDIYVNVSPGTYYLVLNNRSGWVQRTVSAQLFGPR